MELILNLLAWLGGIAAGSAAIAYVARTALSQILSRDLERFKSELQRSVMEHQVQFGALHAKRAEVIAQLYTLLIETQDAFDTAVRLARAGTDEASEKLRDNAADAAKRFVQYFRRNKLYLPVELCALIEALETHFSAAWHTMIGYVMEIHDAELPEDRKRAVELRKEARSVMANDVPSALHVIESVMRRLLGDTTTTAAKLPAGITSG